TAVTAVAGGRTVEARTPATTGAAALRALPGRLTLPAQMAATATTAAAAAAATATTAMSAVTAAATAAAMAAASQSPRSRRQPSTTTLVRRSPATGGQHRKYASASARCSGWTSSPGTYRAGGPSPRPSPGTWYPTRITPSGGGSSATRAQATPSREV